MTDAEAGPVTWGVWMQRKNERTDLVERHFTFPVRRRALH
jgi:hypothetical protein